MNRKRNPDVPPKPGVSNPGYGVYSIYGVGHPFDLLTPANLEDSMWVPISISFPPRFSCGTGNQGISVNCGDLYGRYLDCQWIDITDVPHGFYLLRLIVNPDSLVPETDHANNIVTCAIELGAGFSLRQFWCRLSGDWLGGNRTVRDA